MIVIAVTVCLIFIASKAVARCPNSCNGHGSCGTSNVCACYPQWDGGAADCSARLCPFGTAWADKAYAADIAHQSAECSNAGICDRITGNCKCFSGFTGNACQRSTCPADCSGHGVCSTIGDVSLYDGPDYDPTYQFSGDGVGPQYINWDKNSIQICECDQGFFGADCSRAMCPKGDDPLTVNQNYRSLKMRVQSSSFDLEGRLGLRFMGATVMLTMTAQPATLCTQEIAFHGNFGNVICSVVQVDSQTLDFTFTFYSWPTFPKTNNLFSHDGNPSRLDFFCDLTHVSAYSTCKFTDIETTNVQEYVYCSNRGLCNFATGDCTCNDGFGGPACSNVTYLSHHGADTLPGSQINVNSLDYVSSALQISVAKAGNADFNLIEALAAGEVVFFVRGDGTVGINKLLTLSGGQTVSGGGLFVQSGGVTVASTGLSVLSADETDPVMFLSSTYAGPLGSAYSALRLKMMTSSPSQTNAIELLNQGTSSFAVRGDGHVDSSGGMEITGGVTIYSRGLQVSGGLTVNSAGMRVVGSGAAVTGGVTILTSGLDVSSGGVSSGGGMTIQSGGMKVTGGVTITGAGLSVTGGLTITTDGIKATGGLTVQLRGLVVVTQGATIQSGGLQVSAGGLTVFAGGARLTGGLSVTAGGAAVTGGVTVTTGGLHVLDGGLTVTADGLTVSAGGATVGDGLTVTSGGMSIPNIGVSIAAGGLTVTGGMSVRSGGLVLADSGLTITAGGMVVTTGGVTVSSDGVLVVTSGLSVQAGGIRSTDGVTVYTLGMRVSGGTTISSGGLMVVDGSTIVTGGVVIVTDGLTVSDGGLTAVGGVTISSGGLYLTTSGFTVAAGGVRTQGGFTVVDGGLRVLTNGLTLASGGLTVTANGARISGGVTIGNAGLTVTAGGLLVSTDGMTVSSSGLVVSNGGVSVTNNGFTVGGGATVSSGGLLITTNGLSVVAGGASVAGGVTISTVGLFITTTGITVAGGGISIAAGGLTITNGGLAVENTGMRVKGGGVQVTEGVTINSGGLNVIAGGLNVIGGATITGGATIVGNLFVDNTITTFNSPSDRRLKRDVLPIDNALAKVNKLNGVYFNWIQDEPNGIQFDEKRHVGVLAQEVLHVLPEVVTSIHDGKYLGVDYASMVPLIIEAVRELDELFQAGRISAEEKARHTEALFEQIQQKVTSIETRMRVVKTQLAEMRKLLTEQ